MTFSEQRFDPFHFSRVELLKKVSCVAPQGLNLTADPAISMAYLAEANGRVALVFHKYTGVAATLDIASVRCRLPLF